MQQTGKPFAPKPVKRVCSNNLMRIDSKNGNIIHHFSSFSVKGNRQFGWSNEDIDLYNNKERKNRRTITSGFTEDHNKFKQDFCDESAKSEIASILGMDSSTARGSLLTYTDNADISFEDIINLDEELRSSAIPVRTSNPFYKNFNNEIIDPNECSLTKFHSTNDL